MKKPGKGFIIAFVLAVILSARVMESQAQDFSVRNNLVYDATLTPNLGFDARIDSLWTIGIEVGLRAWPRSDYKTRKYRHLLISPEVRRWFTSAGKGHFVGANILYTHFNVGDIKMPFGLYPSVKHKRKQGDAIALGPFYGYSWNLARHWNLEAEVGFDVGYAWSDVYETVPCTPKIDTDKSFFVMPKVGVNIVYIIR